MSRATAIERIVEKPARPEASARGVLDQAKRLPNGSYAIPEICLVYLREALGMEVGR